MSIAEFFAMGGYGRYIWSAVALMLVMIIIEISIIRRQYKNALRRIKRIQQLRTKNSPGESV